MAKAQVGDLIRITNALPGRVAYENGDIFEVTLIDDDGDANFIDKDGDCAYTTDFEYEIHRKAGEEDAPKSEIIAGVGPDAPVVENEHGAKQSQSPYRMDLIDAKALLKIAEVHKQGGDKYGDTNWHNIPVNDHINHALVHIYAHLAEDTSDEHLAHAATRMIFALALQLR